MNYDNIPTVRELLETAVEKYGDKTFIRFVSNEAVEERSYNKLCQDSKAVCRWIRHFSTDKMNIAIISKTNYEYIACMTGILISGCTAVPFSPDISVDEAAELFERADIAMLLYEDDFADKAAELEERCPFIIHAECIGSQGNIEQIYSTFSDSSQYASLSDIDVDKESCAIIIFTSGTTGVRKGVMLSTRAIVANIMSDEISFDDNDISLSVLPMYHVFCFSGDYLKNLREGIGICLNGNMRDIGKNLLRFEPAVMRVVPMIAQSLLQKVNAVSAAHPELERKEAAKLVFGRNMKWIYSGGAYLNPELTEQYEELGIYLRQGYGMTEAGCRISVPTEETSAASVGKVISICDVRIENGEIQINTQSSMTGYYKMPEETAAAFTEDGWLHTGDLGYVTEDRELFITGRAKNLIILASGENVSPEAIEKKYEEHPLVAEILVFGEGNRIVAEIYPDYSYAKENGITDIKEQLEALTDEMNSTAKSSHVVSELRLRTEPLERTDTGKIKRKNSIV